MSPADANPSSQPFDSLLAAYHEALAAGLGPDREASTADLSPKRATQLRKAAAVLLDRLEEDRRRASVPGGSLDALLSRQAPPAALSGGK